jgi:hypothetical protein
MKLESWKRGGAEGTDGFREFRKFRDSASKRRNHVIHCYHHRHRFQPAGRGRRSLRHPPLLRHRRQVPITVYFGQETFETDVDIASVGR